MQKKSKIKKEKWGKPILTILVRGNRQEMVLDMCKTLYGPGGALNSDNKCESIDPEGYPCTGSCDANYGVS